jgi:hypothetical protein
MDIIHIDTNNRQHVRQWLELPFRLYRDVPQWVPPLAPDARLVLDRRKYPFYEHSEAAFFLAMEGSRAVGRIAAIDNRNYNAFHKLNTAFFYLFECEDSLPASQALFEAAFAWARRRGRDRMTGPKGFTALDGLGLLVKGFEHRPAMGIPYNPPYYEALVRAAGFERLDDDVSGYLSSRTKVPARIHELAERVKEQRGLHVPRFKSRQALKAVIPKLRDLYNGSLGMNFDQVPLTEGEVRVVADQMLSVADPRLIKIVMKGDEPVGFAFAYPDVSAAIQRTKGRLFPFGWADLLLELRRTKWVNLNGAGILPEYQGLGGTVLLFSELAKSVVEGGFEHAEVVQISVSNSKMQLALRDLGIDFYKMHRVYQRAL